MCNAGIDGTIVGAITKGGKPGGRESPLIVVTQLEGPVEGQHGTCQVRL